MFKTNKTLTWRFILTNSVRMKGLVSLHDVLVIIMVVFFFGYSSFLLQIRLAYNATCEWLSHSQEHPPHAYWLLGIDPALSMEMQSLSCHCFAYKHCGCGVGDWIPYFELEEDQSGNWCPNETLLLCSKHWRFTVQQLSYSRVLKAPGLPQAGAFLRAVVQLCKYTFLNKINCVTENPLKWVQTPVESN